MEIRDLMKQNIRIINLLKGRSEYLLKNLAVSNLNIRTVVEESYNAVIEWLFEGMDERNISKIMEIDSFVIFWIKYYDFYKYNYTEKEEFIESIPTENLIDLFELIKKNEDLQIIAKKYEAKASEPIAENKEKKGEEVICEFVEPPLTEEDKMDKYFEKDVSYEEKHGLDEEK